MKNKVIVQGDIVECLSCPSWEFIKGNKYKRARAEQLQHHTSAVDNIIKKQIINGKPCWGSKVIPRRYWISEDKQYVTKNGWNATVRNILIINATHDEVTCPVKVSLSKRVKGVMRHKYNCYTLDGRDTCLGASDWDLIEV